MTIDGKSVWVGSPRFIKENDVDISGAQSEIQRLQNNAKTVVLVAVDGMLQGALGIADTVKSSSARAIAQLQNQGLQVAMLTGDNEATAHAIAREVGITRVFAEVLRISVVVSPA